MSNKNYTNYSKMSAPENIMRKPIDVNETIDEPAPVEVEPTNVTVETTPTIAVAPVDPEPEVTPPAPAKPVKGKVVGCERLRVRKLPNSDSEVLCVIPEGTKVLIDTDKSTVNWYAVSTAAGLNGYCMKKYISTK